MKKLSQEAWSHLMQLLPELSSIYDDHRLKTLAQIDRVLAAAAGQGMLVMGVLASLTYFYFSVEHRGVIKHVARYGIWVLMITFGSSFAFTVMGRITLLTVRLEFLLGRWLGLIDVPR